ncbi:putative SOS response-associated peptidase YedK [Christiangramia gaetbulicola]|uniref:Abasic site processing protein n=1 Tax=Christiangramia gaetbulicola TaxID=703340 RepID=A0A2T6AF65_9FLAO|nr:SOS response-associated peptidase family protein [Christiangramia gaetbulicola]PTX42437.1 putative SOS response-associated peptidase YedK [Christiangramia gaetbulicola]
MCYQKSLNQSEDNLTRYMDKPPIEEGILEPYFLNDGFAHNHIYIVPMDEPGHWYQATWGLVPTYTKPEEFFKSGKYNTLNARDDKVFDSRLYSKPIREGRCLIFADGFFEPHHSGKESQPYFCYLEESKDYRERSIFTFAGIYTNDAEGNYFTSLITVDANPLFEKVHNKAKRMPLVLDRKYEQEWIQTGQSESVIKDIMSEGFTSKSFHAHPVINYRLKKNRELKNTAKVLEPTEPIDKSLTL